LFSSLEADEVSNHDILDEMLKVYRFECNKKRPSQFYYDHIMRIGYFQMSSANMVSEGSIGIGYAHVYPCFYYGIAIQPLSFISLSTICRIFKENKQKFGDKSDQGISFKISLWDGEVSAYRVPSVAIGVDDLFGNKLFQGKYLVLT
jgi:hypothetical protein